MGPGRDRTRDPGSAVRLAAVARHVTDCATRPVQIYACLLCWYSISLFERFDNHCTQNNFTTIEISTYYEKGMQ